MQENALNNNLFTAHCTARRAGTIFTYQRWHTATTARYIKLTIAR